MSATCLVKRYRSHPWGRHLGVWVLRDSYVLLRYAPTGHILGGRILPFHATSADAQKLELAHSVWEGEPMKRKDVSATAGTTLHASPDLLKGHYPNLAEWLTAAVYDDGARRESPTLTVWASGGQWRLSLKDRAEQLVMWLSAEKLLEVMQLAELFVLSEEGPWRQDDYAKEDKGKRVKK